MRIEQALEAARTTTQSVLATIRRAGLPQLSNVVHHVGDDGLIRISTTADTAKYKNLARRPWAALKVDRSNFWSYAVLEGDVELSAIAAERDDAAVEELVELYRSISGEHPDWDDFRRAMVADHRLVVRLRPNHAYGELR